MPLVLLPVANVFGELIAQKTQGPDATPIDVDDKVNRAAKNAAAVEFGFAGCALIVNAAIWQPAAVVASSISLLLMVLFFHPWLLIGIAIDIVIIASVIRWHVPAVLFDQ